MNEKRDRELVKNAVDTCFSDVKGDPWLAQRVLQDKKGEARVKKKLSFGLVLLIVLALLVAVAIAAQQLGWVDIYDRYDMTAPKAAVDALQSTETKTYQVGPMTFTFTQLLTDKRIVLSSAHVHTTDGTEVLYADDTNVYDPINTIQDTIMKRYNLPSGTTWLEAGQQLNLPVYGIRALVEVNEPYSYGGAMEDSAWNEDGTIIYFNMPALVRGAVKDELPATLYMAVTQFDPATGERLERWQVREEVTLPVSPMLSEQTYTTPQSATIAGMTLKSVNAETYATGMYVTCTFAVPDGVTEEALWDLVHTILLCDISGNELPLGMSLSGPSTDIAFPNVEMDFATSLEALPGDGFMLTDGESSIIIR